MRTKRQILDKMQELNGLIQIFRTNSKNPKISNSSRNIYKDLCYEVENEIKLLYWVLENKNE